MKIEEAIEMLEDLDGAVEDNQGRDYDEAFRMAIKALKADSVMRDATAEERASVQKYIDSISTEVVEVVRCKDCKYKRLYDEGDTKYYYCALEDRPNRNWSVDDTDYCSWGEKGGEEE